MLALLLTLLSVTAPQSVTATTWVTIETAPDNAVMGFRPGTKPYSEDVRPRVFEHFSTGRPPTDTKGRVISGAAFYGWEEGDTVHVVALMLVPNADAENRFYSDRNDRRLHYEVASRFAMKRGEIRQTDELTRLFQGRPMAVRVGTQR